MKITKAELHTFKILPNLIESYIAEIPAAAITRKRNQNAWTIQEHLFHIVDVQAMLLGRMQTIISEKHPVIEPYFPQNDVKKGLKYQTMAEAFAEYHAYRKRQLKLLKNASTGDLQKVADHKEYSEYSLPIILKHMVFHEFWHMYRIEEIWLTRDEYFV